MRNLPQRFQASKSKTGENSRDTGEAVVFGNIVHCAFSTFNNHNYRIKGNNQSSNVIIVNAGGGAGEWLWRNLQKMIWS